MALDKLHIDHAFLLLSRVGLQLDAYGHTRYGQSGPEYRQNVVKLKSLYRTIARLTFFTYPGWTLKKDTGLFSRIVKLQTGFGRNKHTKPPGLLEDSLQDHIEDATPYMNSGTP